MVRSKRKHDDSSEENDTSKDDESLNNSIRYDEEGGITMYDIYVPPMPKPPSSLEENGPRLIISKIINNNFKSYGQTQILGPFHKYFNAIVGPNGSGKSNVIDCMLFVFGYRATKIRSKKLSVLLHKSEKYQNVQSCTVSIYFKLIRDKIGEEDMYEEIPNSEFSVSRTAFKDNSSYYQIDGKKVQYKDVAVLLRKHGIDLDHNRFLILQGEVEQISLMKPKAPSEHETGMLEYLEDIIGTARYKVPLSKLEEQIDFLTEQRTEKLTRVTLAEKEKDELKAPMQEAVKFLKLENEIAIKKNFLYQRKIKKVSDRLNEAEDSKRGIVEKYDELKEKLAKILKEKTTCEQAFKVEDDKYEQLVKRKEKLTETFNVANNKDENIRAEMVQINNRRKKVIEMLKKEKDLLESLEKVPQKNLRDVDEYTAKQEELTRDHEKYEADRNKALQSLRKDTISLQEKKEQLQTKLVDLRKIVDETKAEFSLAESKLKLYTKGEETEKKKLQSLKMEFEESTAKVSKHAENMKELKKQIPLTEKQLRDARIELHQNKMEEVRVVADIRSKRMVLEEKKNSMQANRSRGRVLDSLMREKAEGRLPGLFGRLGDLGAIDAKYDVAISTACRALDNIVVDTVDTAQWCIEFLRAYNIGRATFIALEKQEYLQNQANCNIQTPENIPRLFDLVRIEDPRVRTAFYYALRDTLVANDLDQASRTAYGAKRFRVVTLGGDIIETSGTMSGGGTTVLRGRMGRQVTMQTSLTSPKKMEAMEAEMSRLEERATELRRQQCRLEDQISTLQTCVNNMKIELEKSSIEHESLHQNLPNLQAHIRKQEQVVKNTTTSPAELRKLKTIVEEKKTGFEHANVDADKIQTEVDKINKDIKEKTDKKMGGINKKLKECTDLLEKIKAEILKLRVGIKTAERNTKKSRDKIANMEQEKTDCESKMRSMQEQREEIEKDAAIMLDNIQQLTKKLESEQEDFAEKRNTIEKLTEKANKLKAEKIEFDQEIFGVDKIISENKEIVHQTQHRLNQLRLQEIPEESLEELRKYSDQELLETDTRHMEMELKTEEEKVRTAKPNLIAIKEYQKKVANFIQRTKELDEISEKRAEMRQFRDTLRKKRHCEFYEGFSVIARKLKEMYQLITLGGDAELEMVDNYDPFSEGVVLNVRPPKKSWKNITNLSGGEKTLSSLALVFALHYYKPSPLYFMDEIDAALDFKNVSIVANYIKERTKNTQFIIISLRSNMFELADNLIGIFKIYDITRAVPVCPRRFQKQNPVVNAAETVDGNIPESANDSQVAATESQSTETRYSQSQNSGGTITLSSKDSQSSETEMVDPSQESQESTKTKEVVTSSQSSDVVMQSDTSGSSPSVIFVTQYTANEEPAKKIIKSEPSESDSSINVSNISSENEIVDTSR